MPRIHPYGEPRVEDSPISEFFLWLLIIGLGFPMAYGWVFVSLGWISNALLFELSGALGVVTGLRVAFATARHKKEGTKKAVIPAQQIEAVKEDKSQTMGR